jgi:shikimate dehydrogenase
VVLVRDPRRAGDLRASADRLGVELDLRAGLPGPVPAAELVISTLPAGAADGLAPPAGAVVLDVVYAPWPTRFAAAAAAAGGTAVSGVGMLLHQAAAQVELMTGRRRRCGDAGALDAAVRARSEKPPGPTGT